MQRLPWLLYLVSWMLTELECTCMECMCGDASLCDGTGPLEFLSFSMNGCVITPAQQRMHAACSHVLLQLEDADVITRRYSLIEDEFGTYRVYDGGWWWC